MQSEIDIVIGALCAEINRLRDTVEMLEDGIRDKSDIISALDERIAQMKANPEKRGPGRPKKAPAKRGPGRPKKYA